LLHVSIHLSASVPIKRLSASSLTVGQALLHEGLAICWMMYGLSSSLMHKLCVKPSTPMRSLLTFHGLQDRWKKIPGVQFHHLGQIQFRDPPEEYTLMQVNSERYVPFTLLSDGSRSHTVAVCLLTHTVTGLWQDHAVQQFDP